MLSANEIALAKGMLRRGDKQQDIAAHLRVNSGRIAEINNGKLGADVRPAPLERLPKIDTGPRFIDPKAPVERQIEALMALIKNPPENSRRVTFTPELCIHIIEHLKLNEGNRNPRAGAIARYAEDMANGDWRLTGDTIKFGRSGILRDGQHRLRACIRAGVPFETYVVFGIDDLSFAVIDTGRRRNNDDAFKLASIPNEKVAAGATRWTVILTSDDPTNRSVTFTNEELLRAYRSLEENEINLCVSDARSVGKKIKVIHEAALAALLYLFRQKNTKAAEAFLIDLLALKGPAKKLVMTLDQMRVANMGRIHETVRNAMTIKTWRAYAEGRGLRKADLMWNANEPFPEI